MVVLASEVGIDVIVLAALAAVSRQGQYGVARRAPAVELLEEVVEARQAVLEVMDVFVQRVVRRGVGDDQRPAPVVFVVAAAGAVVLARFDDPDGGVVGALDPCRRQDAGGLADGVGGLAGVEAGVARLELRFDRARVALGL